MPTKAITTERAALAAARARWGKKAHIELNPRADVGAARAEVRRDYDGLRSIPPKERTPEQEKSIRQLQGRLLVRRCNVGHIGGFPGFPLFMNEGQGDSWDEAFSQADQRKATRGY